MAATSTTISTSASRRKNGARGEVYYNYGMRPFRAEEVPGISVFYKDDAGDVFHTYSTYGRGVEVMMGTYNLLDLTPKGRDERDVPYKMEWVRHHDRYEPAPRREAGRPVRAARTAQPAPSRQVSPANGSMFAAACGMMGLYFEPRSSSS